MSTRDFRAPSGREFDRRRRLPPPRQSPPPARPPLVTLTTDFGTADAYVAQMKAAILSRARHVVLVDVTHSIVPQDIAGGSIALERAVAAFPAGTIHVAVVDPGVGTARRLMAARANRSLVVCPDNGLITWPHRRHGASSFFEIIWRPAESSDTFHGRDVMAPVAAMLAAGVPLARLARPMHDPVLLDMALAPAGASEGRIIHIDHYGNATTNLPRSSLGAVHVAGRHIGTGRTYADVEIGAPLALMGSSGLLEIAVRNGSAAGLLGLTVGDRVELD